MAFEESALGKPYVAADLPQIQFSVSHNDIASVVAISRTAVVGVDIERLDQEINEFLIAIFCSGYERIQLRRMSKEECTLAFLKLWTLKEAYTKMVGFGFLEDFSALEFEFEAAAPRGRSQFALQILDQDHRWNALPDLARLAVGGQGPAVPPLNWL